MPDLVTLWQDVKKRWVDMLDGTFAERVEAHPPFDLLTDGGTGDHRRLRVDVGQTGFFAGREFRTFMEYDIPTAQTAVLKITVPVNVILLQLIMETTRGAFKLEAVVLGTEGGTFSTNLPIRPANSMTEAPQPPHTPQVSIVTGGTLAGGTVIEIVKGATSGQGAQVASLDSSGVMERGVAPGTYYFRLTNTSNDDLEGVLRMRWEERP
jgi:hypothetical protein